MKIHRSLLAVIALFLSIGCTELVDRSYDRIIAEQFDATDQDLASLVGSAYINWRDVILNWDGFHRAQELSADQLVIPARPNGWVDGGVYRRIHEHKWTSDEGIVVQVWNRAYAGITNCNRIIYQIESNIIPIDPDALESTISELKVLRASYYYVLLDLYGNVPIITQFDVPVGFLPEQSSRREVYDFIVGELVENVDHLSESNDQSTYGKFNKWAGYALLAKLYLNAEVYKSEAEWEKAIQAADMVINSGLYALEASQRNVFVTNNENSKEIIFAIPFDENYVTEWNAFDLHMQTLQPGSQATYNLISTPWGGICAIPQFIDTYDPDDLRLINGWIQGPQLTASGEPIIAS
ncbi:MAG TPA: RagB/SusD family nutrient uptake outer membrane protein, partial [Cyclobacteriaceae bacterium]|nr:RagB/SusD family nutrient uptake outer membrane protein [Cyclobacteriaceae bacterium]